MRNISIKVEKTKLLANEKSNKDVIFTKKGLQYIEESAIIKWI